MGLKKFLVFGLLAAVLPALAEEAADRKTATSLKYVTHELDTRQDKFSAETNKAMEYTNTAGDVQKRAVKSDLGSDTSDTSLPMVGGVNTKLNQKQDDIAAVNDHTAVTYTGTAGQIGPKGIYQPTGTYSNQSDNLIDAKTFNAALKNGLDSEFKCREDNRDPVSGLCWLYTIHNGTAGHSLPTGYTELEYIESTGTQYIDTGFTPNQDSAMVLRVLMPTMTTGAASFGGAHNGAWRPGFGVYGGNTTYRMSAVYNSEDEIIINTPTYAANILYEVGLNKNVAYVTNMSTGTTYTRNFTQQTFTAPHTIELFRLNIAATRYGRFRLYSAKIYDNGVLFQNLIPAKQGNDIGLYDTVSGAFFRNMGSGTFTDGPVVTGNNIYIPQNQQ